MFENIVVDSTVKELDDFHLLKHFCTKHDNISSLKWVVLQRIGKQSNDPAGNLLKWEHSFIEYFDMVWPKGLNSKH